MSGLRQGKGRSDCDLRRTLPKQELSRIAYAPPRAAIPKPADFRRSAVHQINTGDGTRTRKTVRPEDFKSGICQEITAKHNAQPACNQLLTSTRCAAECRRSLSFYDLRCTQKCTQTETGPRESVSFESQRAKNEEPQGTKCTRNCTLGETGFSSSFSPLPQRNCELEGIRCTRKCTRGGIGFRSTFRPLSRRISQEIERQRVRGYETRDRKSSGGLL